MGLFGGLFGPKKQAATPAATKYSQAELEMIVKYVKERTLKPFYRITTSEYEGISLTASKFGGFPYWNPNMEYPKNAKGENLVLLAQINFAEAGLDSELFPKSGLLQFYIETSDLYGMDLDNTTRQNGFRVIYHPETDSIVPYATLKSMGIRDNTNLHRNTDYFPMYREYALQFEPGSDYMNVSLDEFDEMVREAVRELFGREFEATVYREFGKDGFHYLAEHLDIAGHKVLGYPYFTQGDRRAGSKYDTLLLQIDSDFDDILWGDSGVAQFFINSDDLRRLDFSDVMYTWDCL